MQGAGLALERVAQVIENNLRKLAEEVQTGIAS
jgi:hypothetical protein